MKIAITGATGQLGRLVVEKLEGKVAKENLVALVRTPEKAADLGIEARAFDYNGTENLADALKGIDTLLFISGSEAGKRIEQHQKVVSAAKEAGVKKIVYTSLLKADDSTSILAPEHFATEKAILESGLNYTILRNGWYTENYTASIPTALQHGAFIGAAAEGKISSAPREDYAEAAAIVLTTGEHDKKVYELAGDDFYTLSDLAKELSLQVGKDIPYHNLTETDFAEALKGAGLPEGFAGFLATLDTSASHGDLYSERKDLSQLLGRPTIPLKEVIRKAIA